MDIWDSIEFMVNIIDVSLLLYFTYIILGKSRLPYKRAAAAVVLQSAINTILNGCFGIGNLISFSLMYFSTGVIYHLLFGWNLIKIYICSIIGLLIMGIGEMAAMAAVLCIGKASAYWFYHPNIHRMTAVILSKALSLLIIYSNKDRFKNIDKIEDIRLYQFALITGFNVLIGFIAFWFYKYTYITRGYKSWYIILMSLASISFSITVLSILRKISSQIKKEAEWRLKEKEFEKQGFYISAIEDMLKQIKAQRHDFNHHISCIYGLLRMGKTDEAKAYMERLTEDLSSFNNIISAGDPIVSSILNTKMEKAYKEHIKCDIDISIPHKLNLEFWVISIVLGNLLDNAVEACTNMPEDMRRIAVRIHIRQDHLIIKVSNSKDRKIIMPESSIDENYSTKEDKANHGFGLPNIKKTVENMNGFIEIKDMEDTFEVDIAIPY